MIAAFVASASVLAAAPEAAATNSLVAIKIAPENDHVNPLPLSAKEASERFGQLTSGQVSAVTSASKQLFAKLRASEDAQWDGPKLYLSHSVEREYQQASIAELKQELAGGAVTLFDPYSIGTSSGETDAVIMAKIDPAGSRPARWTAIAFVLKGDSVQRIVIAPQPWIRLMSR